MSDIGNEIVTKQDGLQDRSELFSTVPASTSTTTTTTAPITVYPSTDETTTEKSSRRRGVWKRVRVRPIDAFETAESQNIGNQIYNTIVSNNSKEQIELQRDTRKGYKDSVSYNSYKLDGQDEAVAEEETSTSQPHDDDEMTTIHSPGDIDLGTGAPILNATESTTEMENSATTEQSVEMTTIVGDVAESNVVTRRHDVITELPNEYKTEAPATMNDNDFEEYDAGVKSVNENGLATPQPSQSSRIIDEVKQKLTELFSFTDDYDYHENSLKPKVHEYTTIDRSRPATNKLSEESDDEVLVDEEEDEQTEEEGEEGDEQIVERQPSNGDEQIVTEETSTIQSSTEPNIEQTMPSTTTMSSFHRNLMDSVIYATSTSTEISHETEICYRGRCIKTDRQK